MPYSQPGSPSTPRARLMATSERVKRLAQDFAESGIMGMSGEAESGSAGTQPNEE